MHSNDFCFLQVYLGEDIDYTVKFKTKLSYSFPNGWCHYIRRPLLIAHNIKFTILKHSPIECAVHISQLYL